MLRSMLLAAGWMIIITLAGCAGGGAGDDDDDAVATPTPATAIDADGDGYTSDEDCNEQDPEIHPGATEICDQVDNNCNSQTDEGFPTETYYPDQDGDTFGDSDGEVSACSAPDGYVTRGDDCDDTNADVNPTAVEVACNGVDENCSGMDDDHPDRDGDGYDICESDVAGSDGLEIDCDDTVGKTHPGAAESCDERDNDCDGDVDEDLPLNTYYLDADGDLHGTPDETIEACGPPAGYVSNADDCDDDNSTTFEGAPETLADNIDSNCNGYADWLITVSATGDPGYAGDGGPVSEASFNEPHGLAIDRAGNIYVADTGNHVIRKIDTDGTVTTIAGTGNADFFDGIGTSAAFDTPTGLACDGLNLYIADTGNHRIRKYDPRTELITTVAGSETQGYGGDGGFAMNAQLSAPQGVAITTTQDLYIADTGNHVIRMVSPMANPAATPIIETIAGNGSAGYDGDGGPASDAVLNAPAGITVDTNGTIFFADTGNHVIREIERGSIRRYAGTYESSGYDSFDEGTTATYASLDSPTAITLNTSKVVFFCDTGNNRVRQVTADVAEGYVLWTVAGNGETVDDTGAAGAARSVALDSPQGLVIDGDGNLWIADTGHGWIRMLIP